LSNFNFDVIEKISELNIQLLKIKMGREKKIIEENEEIRKNYCRNP